MNSYMRRCVYLEAQLLKYRVTIKEISTFKVLYSRVEVGWNTSIVALQVVRGTNGESSARGYNWATLFPGDINTGTWLSRLGQSQMRQ
jgi:hypothetical protein